MKNMVEFSRLMERTMHKYLQVEKQPHDYGPGVTASQTEIHAVAIIGDTPDINITELARLRGGTKGAASQLVYRLVDKGLVEKKPSPNSDTEVCLSLTKNGKLAYKGHNEYHKKIGSAFMKYLEDMPEEFEEQCFRILEGFEKELDEKLKK
jgi:DNA-binding MarR family transcriptional regulator